jgi:DNA-binding winged helix-turn-helix (wHTH) protein/tetratricopeptide (TPR) repeat protein
MPDQGFVFGPFRLDPRVGLMRGGRQVRLTPRALAVLSFLVGHRDRVVEKEELFDAVWRRIAVGDAALATCIQELRRALRDKARSPRYIETLHRRGYRFIAAPLNRVERNVPAAETTLVVGRERELAELGEALELAWRGRRQLVLVSGEAGIGKTTLVRSFLSRVANEETCQLAWGQSAEHYGAAEPYHPIIEALTRLCRDASRGNAMLRALERHAPLWLTQMPSLVSRAKLAALQRRTAGATRERMQRELTEALEAAAAEATLILWLEDLHWADVSTVDWLAAFARRPEEARLLVIVTYRPAEARADRHPLHALQDELRRQGGSRALGLGPLTREAVGDYVAARFTPHAGSAHPLARLAGEVHRRTEGSPLFMVGVLDELVGRGLLARNGDAWAVRGGTDLAELGIPGLLRQAIDRQIERLPEDALELAQVASLVGLEFSAAAVAAGAGTRAKDVEAACQSIVREYRILYESQAEEWPDGTVASRFGFVHALYREALHERLPAGRRVELHRRIGARLAQAYERRSDEIAAQLAMHFDRGRDPVRAIAYFRKAGEASLRRKAPQEAASHYERALGLAQALPLDRSRDELEVALRLALCAPLLAIHGMGSERLEACAAAARTLCARLGDHRGHFAAQRLVWNHSLMRYPVPTSLGHASELMAAAKTSRRPPELALAHRALGCSLLYGAKHDEADRLLRRGVALADKLPDSDFAAYGEHPGMICRAFGAWAKALMGAREQATRLADAGIEHARRRDEPHGLAFALVTAGLLHLIQRDLARAEGVAEEVLALSRAYELPQWIAFGHEISGWTACRRGDFATGIELMREALAKLHATGARTHSSRILANLAEACLDAGDAQGARLHIDAALAHRERHGEEYYAPELYRLRALVMAAEGASLAGVEAALREAVALARTQGARLLEERAASSLAELRRVVSAATA